MNNCTILLNKLLGIIDQNFLEKLIEKYNSDYKIQKLTTKVHLFYLIYFHLTKKVSLADFVADLESNDNLNEAVPKISKSQLSRKNENRSYKIFFETFQHLFDKLKAKVGFKETLKEVGSVKALDSSTISLCLSAFPWANFRKNKGGIKLHTLYDLNAEAPENIIITEALMHDKKIFANLDLNPACTYIFDRAYIDYQKFDEFIENDIYFVTRAKSNTKIEVVRSLEPNQQDKDSGVLKDADVILGNYNTKTRMKNELRLVRVKFIDSNQKERTIDILTNRFDLEAYQIAQLYKERWNIELFFKWIKQNLKIKKFFGQNKNAVFIQIYSAIILLLLLRIIKEASKFSGTLLKLTRKIRYSIFSTVNTESSWKQWISDT